MPMKTQQFPKCRKWSMDHHRITHGSCQDWCIQIVLVYSYQGQGALPIANLGEGDVLYIMRHQSVSPRRNSIQKCAIIAHISPFAAHSSQRHPSRDCSLQ